MQIAVNGFKLALQADKKQIRLWIGLTDPYATEAVTTSESCPE
jgi:2-keto-3-deoxy-L-rhamnonate aldolase RhmA